MSFFPWSTIAGLGLAGSALFGSAWARFFLSTAPDVWLELGVLTPFLAEPAAVRNLRRHVGRRSAPTWRRVRDALRCRAQSVSWLSAEQRAELDRCLQ